MEIGSLCLRRSTLKGLCRERIAIFGDADLFFLPISFAETRKRRENRRQSR